MAPVRPQATDPSTRIRQLYGQKYKNLPYIEIQNGLLVGQLPPITPSDYVAWHQKQRLQWKRRTRAAKNQRRQVPEENNDIQDLVRINGVDFHNACEAFNKGTYDPLTYVPDLIPDAIDIEMQDAPAEDEPIGQEVQQQLNLRPARVAEAVSSRDKGTNSATANVRTQINPRGTQVSNQNPNMTRPQDSLRDRDLEITGEVLTCPTCGFFARKPVGLATHRRKIHGYTGSYVCGTCGAKCSSSVGPQTHMQCHASTESIQERSQDILRTHLSQPHLPRPPLYSCVLCGQDFGNVEEFHAHKHFHTSRVPTRRTPFICTRCGKGCKTHVGLRLHSKIHTRKPTENELSHARNVRDVKATKPVSINTTTASTGKSVFHEESLTPVAPVDEVTGQAETGPSSAGPSARRPVSTRVQTQPAILQGLDFSDVASFDQRCIQREVQQPQEEYHPNVASHPRMHISYILRRRSPTPISTQNHEEQELLPSEEHDHFQDADGLQYAHSITAKDSTDDDNSAAVTSPDTVEGEAVPPCTSMSEDNVLVATANAFMSPQVQAGRRTAQPREWLLQQPLSRTPQRVETAAESPEPLNVLNSAKRAYHANQFFPARNSSRNVLRSATAIPTQPFILPKTQTKLASTGTPAQLLHKQSDTVVHVGQAGQPWVLAKFCTQRSAKMVKIRTTPPHEMTSEQQENRPNP